MSFLGPRHTNFLPPSLSFRCGKGCLSYCAWMNLQTCVLSVVKKKKKNKNHLRPVFSERLVSPAPLLSFAISLKHAPKEYGLLFTAQGGPRALAGSLPQSLPCLPSAATSQSPRRCPLLPLPSRLPAAALFWPIVLALFLRFPFLPDAKTAQASSVLSPRPAWLATSRVVYRACRGF